MKRFLAIFFFWPVGYGWLWGRRRQPIIPDEIPGFTREPVTRPDPFGIRPEMEKNEMPLATFSRAPQATPTGMAPPAAPNPTGPPWVSDTLNLEPKRRKSDDEDEDSGVGTALAVGFLAAELLEDTHSEPAAPETAEWKGEGGQFSGGGASGSWEPEDPIDNHAADNTDVSDNSDVSDSTSDSSSDSSYDSGSDSSSSCDSSSDSF